MGGRSVRRGWRRACARIVGLAAVLLVAGCHTEPAVDAGLPEPPADSAQRPTPPVMAITLDDLPWVGGARPGEPREVALGRIITALVEREAPAVAFANCERAGADASTFRQWLAAGLELGNHTSAHLDLNDAPLEEWLRDVRTCDALVRELSGQQRVYFRYPYLHQGPSAERQQAAQQQLREVDSPVAHVTIDNSDYILAVAYAEAVRDGSAERSDSIGAAFIEHIVSATQHYRQVSQARVGRDVAHVLLLHFNLLVSDHLGALLDRLRSEGFRFISLDEAQRDPVYARPDDYTGPDGLSWLYRFEPAAPQLSEWDDTEAARLRGRWR